MGAVGDDVGGVDLGRDLVGMVQGEVVDLERLIRGLVGLVINLAWMVVGLAGLVGGLVVVLIGMVVDKFLLNVAATQRLACERG